MAQNDVQRISSIDNPDQSGPWLFAAALGLILVGGLAATVFFAVNRESNIGVSPEANIDHWHSVYLVHDCGADMPITGEFETGGGLHTHGDGLLHIHPYNPNLSGNNATLGNYFAAYDAELTDTSFTPGFADNFRDPILESDGCNGEDAVLQLAVWRNAFDETAEPEIFTEDLADFTFETAGMALTLALLPEGAEIPKPSPERIASLLQSGVGGPVFGIEEGQSPVILDPANVVEEAPAEEGSVVDDAESTDAESTDAESTDAESTDAESTDAGADE